jgi:hypothetical protein
VLKSFGSKTAPPALSAEAETLRFWLVSNSQTDDSSPEWLSRYWIEHGDFALLARIEQLDLPLLAEFGDQRVLLKAAKRNEKERAVKLTDEDGNEEESCLSRIEPARVLWRTVRAAMLAFDDETYAKRAATRPEVKLGSVSKELGALAGRASIDLDELSKRLANRRLMHEMLFACPRDTTAANEAAREIVEAMEAIDIGPLTPPFDWWIIGSDAYLLLANVDEMEVAKKLNFAVAGSYHSCARIADAVVARFGKEAVPLMEAWLPRLARYRAEKAQVERAIKQAR